MDYKNLLTISNLETVKFYPGPTYKIAIFITRQRSWVGQSYREWSTEDWHCWVGIIRKLPEESGMTRKEIIIWDSNFYEHSKLGILPRAMGSQNVLVEKMSRKSIIEQVWIGWGGEAIRKKGNVFNCHSTLYMEFYGTGEWGICHRGIKWRSITGPKSTSCG